MFALFIPVPIVFYYTRLGRELTLALLVISALGADILLSAMGRQAGFFFFLGLGFMGLALAEGIRLNRSIERTLLASLVLVLAFNLGTIGVAWVFYGGELWTNASKHLQETIRHALAGYIGKEAITADSEGTARVLEGMLRVFLELLPGLLVSFTLLNLWGNFLIVRRLFGWLRRPFPRLEALNRWRAPDQFIWVAILGGILLLFPAKALKVGGINLLIFSLTIYFLQGIAIVSFFFEAKRIPPPLRTLGYILLAIQQLLALAVIVLGLFDLWADFRKIKRG